MKKKLGIMVLMFSIVMSVGCNKKVENVNEGSLTSNNVISAEKENEKEIEEPLLASEKPENRDEKIKNSIKEFSFDLFKMSYDEKENTLVSPLSLYVDMSMLSNYADGESYKEINEIMLNSTEISNVNEYISKYLESVKLDSKVMEELEKKRLKEEAELENQKLKELENKVVDENKVIGNKADDNKVKGNKVEEDAKEKKVDESEVKEKIVENGITNNQEDRDSFDIVDEISNGAVLSIGNSIWKDKSIIESKESSEIDKEIKEKYKAEIKTLDFKDTKALEEINNWVNKSTFGKIEKIMDSLSDDSRAFLINTLYFNGKWQVPFDETNTKKEKFKNSDGNSVEVDTMHLYNKEIPYFYSENIKAVKLNYTGNKYSMVILNGNNRDLKDVVEGFEPDYLDIVLNNMNYGSANLILPKFKVENKTELKNIIKDMGMGSIFKNSSDFIKMGKTDEEIKVADIYQKGYIDVNETGTEAAIASVIVMEKNSVIIDSKPIEIKFNEPFIYIIMDNEINLPVFMGAVNNLE